MHAPVLVAEVISHLAPARGGLFVDCTLGAGGHTRALLDAGANRVLGFDRDRTALALAAETLQDRLDRVEMVHADYRSLGTALDSRGIAYEEVSLDDDPGFRQKLFDLTGGWTVPQILIDGRPIGGYTELWRLDKSGQLDARLAA